MDNFISLKKNASLKDVLEVLCKAEEFSDVRFHSDKKLLNSLNKDPLIRYYYRLS